MFVFSFVLEEGIEDNAPDNFRGTSSDFRLVPLGHALHLLQDPRQSSQEQGEGRHLQNLLRGRETKKGDVLATGPTERQLAERRQKRKVNNRSKK